MPLPPLANATAVLDYARGQLQRAVHDPKHDWHWPQLATADGAVRVVVLRAFDTAPPTWRFFTDRRAAKVEALARHDGLCEACFYHGRHRTQLRLRGRAVALDGAESRSMWAQMRPGGKQSYATAQAPGTPLDEAGDGLTAAWRVGEPDVDEDEAAFANFLAYEVAVERADLLQLSDHGQRRARWTQWSPEAFTWVVP